MFLTMSKKIKIIIPVIIFLLIFIVVGGFFWWQRGKIENYFEQKETEKVFALAKDYKINETPEGKFIENKKDGFRAKVSDEWRVEIGADMFGYLDDTKVILGSPNFSYQPSQGCLIEIQITRAKNKKEASDFLVRTVEEVKRDIILAKETERKDHFPNQEVISINGKDALKNTFPKEGKKENLISIELPSEERVYTFEVVFFSEECKKNIDEFLNSVSIQ
jgi:hypothetical protein